MLTLEPLLQPDLTLMLNNQQDRDSVFRMLASAACRVLDDLDAELIVRAMVDRERRLPTSTPEGVAFPHAILPQIRTCVLVPALTSPPVDFGVRGHPPVSLAFGIFGCTADPMRHVQLLARLARIIRGEGALMRLRQCNDAAALYQCLLTEDRRHPA